MRVLTAALVWATLSAPLSFAQQSDLERQPATEQPAPVELRVPEPLHIVVDPPDNPPEPLHVVVDTLPSPPDKREPASSTDPVWFFLEKWSWLIGFALIALTALYAGVKDATKSVAIETDVEEARSAQRLIEANDATGQDKLNTITAKYPVDQNKRKRVRNWLLLVISIIVFTLGAFGVVGLLALTLWPEETVWGPYHFQHAKTSAWEILDSNFTTAFAATWIALLERIPLNLSRIRRGRRSWRIRPA